MDKRVAVTFGPATRNMEYKLRSNLIRGAPRAPFSKERTKNERNAIENLNSIKKFRCKTYLKGTSPSKLVWCSATLND